MIRNSKQAWGSLARAFHWGMALMILIQVPLGFWMVAEYDAWSATWGDDTWVMRTSQWHHTLGFLILAAVTLRLTWRALNPRPTHPADQPLWQRWLAGVTHAFLYGLMLAFPLSGWASLSSYEGEFPIFFFGIEAMPRIVPRVPEEAPFGFDFFSGVHELCWQIGAVLLALHIVAALWHQFVAGDGILTRMWRGSADS